MEESVSIINQMVSVRAEGRLAQYSILLLTSTKY